MSKSIGPRFRFPIPQKDALKLLRVQADALDKADGADDVDEKAHITDAYAEQLWRHARTPTAKGLAAAAAGRTALFGHEISSPNASVFMGTVPKKVGTEQISSALEQAESRGPLDESSLTNAFNALGFVRDAQAEEQAGCMVFGRGKLSVGVRVNQLGAIRAVEMAVEASAKGSSAKGFTEEDSGKRASKAGDEFTDLHRGSAFTYVAGTLVKPKVWRHVTKEFLEVMDLAREALVSQPGPNGEPDLPVEFEALKRFIKSGASEDDRIEDAQELAELRGVQGKISKLWSEMVIEGTAPKGVMLQFDGPDGAGKTSSSKYIYEALLQANDGLPDDKKWELDTEIFKAPTDEDKAWMKSGAGADTGVATWQLRHVMRGIPDEHTIMVKDRFQPGDYVYVGDHTDERATQMGKEFATYEKMVQSQGVLSFKAILWADAKKQAKTFGKRMGRGAFTDVLRAALEERGCLTDTTTQALDDIKNKVEAADMVAIETLPETLERYRQFAAAADGAGPFPVIESTDRHAARLELLERFLDALQQHRGAVQQAS